MPAPSALAARTFFRVAWASSNSSPERRAASSATACTDFRVASPSPSRPSTLAFTRSRIFATCCADAAALPETVRKSLSSGFTPLCSSLSECSSSRASSTTGMARDSTIAAISARPLLLPSSMDSPAAMGRALSAPGRISMMRSPITPSCASRAREPLGIWARYSASMRASNLTRRPCPALAGRKLTAETAPMGKPKSLIRVPIATPSAVGA